MRISILAAFLAALVPAQVGAAVLFTGNESFFIADTGAELLPIDPLVGPDETKALASPSSIGRATFTATGGGSMSLVGQDVDTRYGQDFLRFGAVGSGLTIDLAPGTTAFGFRLGGNQTFGTVQICADELCFFTAPPNTGFRFFGFKDVDGLSSIRFANSLSQSIDLSAMRLAGAVPEPATWAMLIAGFGIVGARLRKRRLAAESCFAA